MKQVVKFIQYIHRNFTFRCKLLLLFLLTCNTGKSQTATIIQSSADSIYLKSEELWNQGDTLRYNQEMERLIETFYLINNGDNIGFISAEFIYAVRLNEQEKHIEAKQLLEDAHNRISRVFSITIELTCLIEYHLAQTYNELKLHEDATRIGEKMIGHYGMFYGKRSEEYLHALYLLSTMYFSSKNYPKCKDITTEYLSRSVNEDLFDESKFADCYSFALLAESEAMLGNISEAEECFIIADTLLAKQEGTAKIRAHILNQRAVNLIKSGNLVLADSCLNAAFELDTESITNMVSSLNTLSVIRLNDEPSKSYETFSFLVSYMEENEYQNTPLYAIVKANLAYACLLLDLTEEGIFHVNHAISILSKQADFSSLHYLASLQTRILLYAQKDDQNMVESCSRNLSGQIKKQLQSVFPYLTERQRTDVWNQIAGWTDVTLPYLTILKPTNNLNTECYNAILQSRGILLNSTLNIDRILRNTDDANLKELYQQWKVAKKKKMDTYVIEELEKKIMKKLPTHGDFLADMNINADSVKTYLRDKEIAIEFFSVMDFEQGDTLYAALCLKNNYESPHLYVLCRSTDIPFVSSESFCSFQLFQLFWGKLLHEVQDVETVFFSVDGVLHNIPIEFCPNEEGVSIFGKYDCYRLSSTREVVKHRRYSSKSSPSSITRSFSHGEVVLCGDIDYNTYESHDLTQHKVDSIHHAQQFIDSTTVKCIKDTIDSVKNNFRSIIRGNRYVLKSFISLDGARMELLSIKRILEEEGVIPTMMTKHLATEDNVYRLSNSKPRWLHFATHGYYENIEQATEFGIKADIEDISESEEALALSRSALVFAGANKWIEHGEKSQEGYDGLVTAYEISTQDFANVDMVVMSACESGLGDINGDGVFGLQRGMKKAGVNSLLMSLCRVNDDATTLFMISFYKELLKGSSKLRALSEAQKVVKSTNNGIWSAPQFWASFILLDGF